MGLHIVHAMLDDSNVSRAGAKIQFFVFPKPGKRGLRESPAFALVQRRSIASGDLTSENGRQVGRVEYYPAAVNSRSVIPATSQTP
ncbi:MAG: hypothetical protein DMF61_13250 [Blastocatellia bacterium AA13]|nr:MAG: hypothetical protein DMF61_13250 [Blastocatellia bacterium AA13]